MCILGRCGRAERSLGRAHWAVATWYELRWIRSDLGVRSMDGSQVMRKEDVAIKQSGGWGWDSICMACLHACLCLSQT